MAEMNKPVFQLDITGSELFLELIEFNLNGELIDLHNYYTCRKIDYGPDSRNLILEFWSNDEKHQVFFEFQDSVIINMSLSFGEEEDKLSTLYRGRLVEDSVLVDVSKDMQYCFYIIFNNESSFELLCKKALLKFR